MAGTILLTGGTGKIASRIASRLRTLSIPVLITSRKEGADTVKFDWYDESTYTNPFSSRNEIEAIYLVLPSSRPGVDLVALVKKFINLAIEKGTKRFVLNSASVVQKGGPAAHGQVHAYLESLGERVDFAVVKPSFFFDNFVSRFSHNIKASNQIISATGAGKMGFVSEGDIADVAVSLLTSATPLGGVEKVVMGPELLSYDDVAALLTRILGRTISHRSVTIEERTEGFVRAGVPADVAGQLALIEGKLVANGAEETLYTSKEAVKGKKKLGEFLEENKGAFEV